MRVELFCEQCGCRFAASPEASVEEIADQMFVEGPPLALGDGETFEDMIFNTLMEQGHISCPDCGEPVHVSEESLGVMALSLLQQW